MERSRSERYRLMLAHKAAASALEAGLKDEAAAELEKGVRVTWELVGGGSVVVNLRHDSTSIADTEAFMEWLALAYPHQVQRICRLEAINAKWIAEAFLPTLVPFPEGDEPDPEEAAQGARYPVLNPDGGAVVPGAIWTKGGGLASVSIRNDPAAVRRMNLAAAEYAQGTGTMPGLEPGERA